MQTKIEEIVVTDIEGDMDLFLRFLENLKKTASVVDIKVLVASNNEELTLANYKTLIPDLLNPPALAFQFPNDMPNLKLRFLGDASKGPYSAAITQLLISNPERVLCLNGNRDVNQLLPLVELPQLGKLIENEIKFIQNPDQAAKESPLDRLLSNSKDAIRYKKQYVNGVPVLNHVDPGKNSFLLTLLLNQSVDNKKLFSDAEGFTFDQDTAFNKAVNQYRNPKQFLPKDQTLDADAEKAAIAELKKTAEAELTRLFDLRLGQLKASILYKILQKGISFENPLTDEQKPLLAIYYKWSSVNSIGEGVEIEGYFASMKIAAKESGQNLTEVEIALARLMESLSAAQRQKLDSDAANRDGVFFTYVKNAKAIDTKDGIIFTHSLSGQADNQVCENANAALSAALSSFSDNGELALKEEQALALHLVKMLSLPSVVYAHYRSGVQGSTFCNDSRKPAAGAVVPVDNQTVFHGHASNNPVFTNNGKGVAVSADSTYIIINGKKVAPVILIGGMTDNAREVEIHTTIQCSITKTEKKIHSIALSLQIMANGQVQVVKESVDGTKATNFPSYGATVKYVTRDAKDQIIKNTQTGLSIENYATIIGMVDNNTVRVAIYQGFDFNQVDVPLKNIVKDSCHLEHIQQACNNLSASSSASTAAPVLVGGGYKPASAPPSPLLKVDIYAGNNEEEEKTRCSIM